MSWGHPPQAVLRYTPRQISGWLHFGGLAHKRDLADRLVVGALAARGDKKAVDKQLKELGA